MLLQQEDPQKSLRPRTTHTFRKKYFAEPYTANQRAGRSRIMSCSLSPAMCLVRALAAAVFGAFVAVAFGESVILSPQNISRAINVLSSYNAGLRFTLAWNSATTIISSEQQYDWDKSTEENYRAQSPELYGRFRHVRHHIDYGYHSVYSRSRQSFQDAIIDSLLKENNHRYGGNVTNRNSTRTKHPWVVSHGIEHCIILHTRTHIY